MLIGGAGFIGSHLVQRLTADAAEVAVVDLCRPPATDRQLAHVMAQDRWASVRKAVSEFHTLDVADPVVTAAAVAQWNPTRIVFLAALLARDAEREWRTALRTQAAGTQNALLAASDLTDLRRFVYVSSSFVYGRAHNPPIEETASRDPIGIYGVTKAMGEDMVRAVGEKTGMPTVVVRPSAVYGFGDSHIYTERVTSTLIFSAITGEGISVEAADKQLDFTYVADAVDGIHRALYAPGAVSETFNISRGVARTIGDFARAVRHNAPALQIDVKSGPEDSKRRGALSVEKAKQLLGYQPVYDIEEGVAAAIRVGRAALADAMRQGPAPA